MDNHDDRIAELVAYALGSLPASERKGVEAHVATCAECAERLADYRRVTGALPLALPPVAPPSAAWDAVRAALRGGQVRRRADASRVARWGRASRWPAVAALVASLVVWNVVLERRIANPPPGPQVDALSRRPGRLVILRGRDQAMAAARIFVAVDGHHGHMAISGLAPLARERAYQLWFVPKDAPAESGAQFRVDPTGRAWVTITVARPLDDFARIVVTEEPVQGSAVPTAPYLLEAESWR